MTRPAVVAVVVFLVALALRLAYVVEHHERLQLDVSELAQTDNYVFARWAEVIAGGDVLCREQPHAHHYWTEEVAPEDRWLEWYGGATTFHQSPLYPYLVAVVYAVFGVGDHLALGIVQGALGALCCALTALLAMRTIAPRAGLVAGLLLAFCAPYYFYDAFVLRDGLMALFVIVLALALERAATLDTLLRWFVAGAALGLFTLAKETGLPLLLLTLVGLVLWRRRPGPLLARRLACVLVGWLLLVAPVLARNAAVGAPLMKFSTRGPEVFVTGNAQGQDGVGWDPPVDTLRQILMDSNFSLPRSMALTLATHRSDPLGYLELLWNKTEAYFNGYEVPNNVNFALHSSHLSTLRLGIVSLTFLSPAALLGVLLSLSRRRRMAVPLLLFGAVSASVIALYMLARFRLQALPLFAVLAAATIDWALTAVQRRRWYVLATMAIPFALLTRWTWSDADPYGDASKNTSIMLQLAKVRSFDSALRYRDLLVTAMGDGWQSTENAWKLDALQGAFDAFEEAQALPDDDPQHHLLMGSGYLQLMRPTKRGDLKDFTRLARMHYQRALELDPLVVGSRFGIGRVLFEDADHPQFAGQARDYGPALSWYVRELREHPDHGPSHWHAGRIRYAWGDLRQALQHFLAAEAAGIDEAGLLAGVASISVHAPLADAAPVPAPGGGTVPVVDEERGLAYALRALAADPEDPNVLDAVAKAYYVHGRYQEAVGLLKQLATLQPWRAGELAARVAAYRDRETLGQPVPQEPATQPGEDGPVEDDEDPTEGGADG